MERLEPALALFMVVAWRITHLMRLGRSCPDLDAALFFEPDELRGADLLTAIAQLGLKEIHVAAKTLRSLRSVSDAVTCV